MLGEIVASLFRVICSVFRTEFRTGLTSKEEVLVCTTEKVSRMGDSNVTAGMLPYSRDKYRVRLSSVNS